METTVQQRLKEYIKHKGLSVNAFERKCGLSTGYVGNMRVSIQPDKIKNISHNFPDLNTGWLLTGEGEMIKSDAATTEPDRIVEMKDGILGAAETIAERIITRNPHMGEFAKVADACQRAVAMSETLVASNAKLVDQLTETLARIETKIDSKGAAGVAKGAARTGE